MLRPLARTALVAALLAVPGATAADAAKKKPRGPAPRAATAAQERAMRTALRPSCQTTAKRTVTAISGRNRRWAILNFDDTKYAGTLCTAILRRSSVRATRWRVVERTKGLATMGVAISPCPKSLPRDLRGTVWPRGAKDPVVYCGN